MAIRNDLPLTQGVCSGDLLFAEACRQGEVRVQWLRQLSNGISKVQFICLWNGSGGDGPGGTAHMYQEVNRRTGQVTWIDSRIL